MHDLVITSATIVDGTGADRVTGDIAVDDGRIVEVGKVGERGRRTLDADGRIVSPGFIDVHTHYDVQGFWDKTLSPSSLHGVTTVVAGNCGFSVAPLAPESGRFVMTMLAWVENMPLAALEAGASWDWASTAEYLDRIDGTLAINTGYMVGHSAIRRLAMGADASERLAGHEEVEKMKTLLRAGLAAGGMGFSSSWSVTHNDADGVPVPSRHASAEELIELASVCREFNGTSLEFLPGIGQSGEFSEGSGDLMTAMSVAAQRPLNWNPIIATAATLGDWLKRLEVSSQAREMGGKVVGLAFIERPSLRWRFSSGFGLEA